MTPRKIPGHLRGHGAFDNEADFEKLWRHRVRGWTFSRTRISDNYSYEDLRSDKFADAMEVLIMNEEKDVEVYSSQRSIAPEAGDTIVYFARAQQSHASEIADAPVG